MPQIPTHTSLDSMTHAAECLKAIAHPVRLLMIELLLDHRMTVGELAIICNTPQNVASEHLLKLKDRGLLKVEREGRNAYYTIAEPGLRSIIQCIQARFR